GGMRRPAVEQQKCGGESRYGRTKTGAHCAKPPSYGSLVPALSRGCGRPSSRGGDALVGYTKALAEIRDAARVDVKTLLKLGRDTWRLLSLQRSSQGSKDWTSRRGSALGALDHCGRLKSPPYTALPRTCPWIAFITFARVSKASADGCTSIIVSSA